MVRVSHKALRLGMRFRPGQMLEVVVPYRVNISHMHIEHYMRQHAAWISKHINKSDSSIFNHPNLTDHSQEHFNLHRNEALDFVTHKVKHWNQNLGRKYHQIKVKSLKSKRGSCSSRGNLNFNYKLLFLPDSMADYIVVHELCHLREMNHGPRFWALVEKIYGPDWKQWRKIR